MKRTTLSMLPYIMGLAGLMMLFGLQSVALAQNSEIADAQEIVASGKFVTIDPNDPLHWGRGAIKIFKDRIVISEDFETAVGPNLHLYLVDRESVTESEHIIESEFVDIGPLPARKGGAIFKLPAGIDLKKYATAVIWCDDFKSLFSPAKLKFSH